MKLLALLSLVFTLGCQEVLLQDLNERDANATLFTLYRSGITATKSRSASGWSILVDGGEMFKATEAITRVGLLRDVDAKAEGNERRFLLSRGERAHLLEVSVATRIEQTLEALPGVLDAKVNLFLQLQDSLRQKQRDKAVSASAVLIVAGSYSVEQESVVRIIQGAAAIPRSHIEVVTVVDERFANKIPPEIAAITEKEAASLLATEPKTMVEQYSLYTLALALAFIVVLLSVIKFRIVARQREAFRKRMAETSEQTLKPPVHSDLSAMFAKEPEQKEYTL